MDALASHMNAEGFHLQKSKIPGYNREKFDLSGYLAEHPLSDFSTEAAASVPAATSGASQPQATQAGALPSSLLRGPQTFTDFRHAVLLMPSLLLLILFWLLLLLLR